MPTCEKTHTFLKDVASVDELGHERFMTSVRAFIDDLKSDRNFRPGLRVKRVQGTASVWEMRWASDGRATFEYGKEIGPGEPHVLWRRWSWTQHTFPVSTG